MLAPVSAQAGTAGLPLDPGFEQNCAGVPCNWTPTAGTATITRDTTNPHSGAASLQVVLSSTAVETRSACITGISGGVYDTSFFYRTSSVGLTGVSGRFNFYSSSDCTTGLSQVIASSTPTADGAWHQVSARGEAPGTIRSFLVGLTFNCGACAGSPSVNFDDVVALQTNLALDPGFEQNCAGVPCNWTPTSGAATITRDTTNPHSGSASLHVVLTSTAVETRSACITAVTGGVHETAFSYRTSSAGLTSVSGRFNFYSSSDCTTGISQVVASSTPTADGAWHQVSARGETPGTARSFRVGLTFSCGACAGSPSVNFDDVGALTTNLTLDPGFEQNCTGVPCNWAPTSGAATITRDTTGPHSGAASLNVVLTSTSVETRSACITGATGGVYDVSFFYRTSSAGLTGVSGRFNFYTSTDCTTGISQVLASSTPTADGAWHQISARGEAPGTTGSFRVGLTFSCGACAGSPSVNFDDAYVGSDLIFANGFE